jgi:AcrR family transcriptional regulator
MDMLDKARTTSNRRKVRKTRLGREAWLTAAKEALIAEGIGGVEIGKLARKLKATRGGFYWFFSGRRRLLNLLLTDWEETNTAALKAIAANPALDGPGRFKALINMWVSEAGYDPQWDAAIREWARISPRVAETVRRIDDERIEIIHKLFYNIGYQDPDAFIRARVTYYHQIGYYALDVHESRAARIKLMPLYVRVLTGLDV